MIWVGVTLYLTAKSFITGFSRTGARPESDNNYTVVTSLREVEFTCRTVCGDVYPLLTAEVKQILLNQVRVHPDEGTV